MDIAWKLSTYDLQNNLWDKSNNNIIVNSYNTNLTFKTISINYVFLDLKYFF